MDLFELIKADHRKVDTIFSEIEKTENTEKLYEYFNQLYKELNVHARTEELTLYPTMRERKKTEKLVQEAEEEHVEAKELLEEIKSFSPTSSEFKVKIAELKDAVQHHVREEESEIFAKVRQSMNDEELKRLAREFQDTKSKVQEDVPTLSV